MTAAPSLLVERSIEEPRTAPGDVALETAVAAPARRVVRTTAGPRTSVDDIALADTAHRQGQERLANLSAIIVLGLATLFCGVLALFGNPNVTNTAMQTLGVIVGAAASAVWQQGRPWPGRKP